MGVVYSMSEILSSSLTFEVIEETRPDGTRLITRKKDPFITSLTVIAAAGIMIIVLDGGNGTISRVFGRQANIK